MASIATSRARMAQRPAGAGAQLLLLALLARAGIALDDVRLAKPAFPTGPDIAQAIRAGRIDCGITTRSVARTAGLDFLPLTWERFDLVLRQRDYFLSPQQALFAFLRTAAFAGRAGELTGYDVSEAGQVRRVN
jgi:molybdate-binding protein